MGARAVENTADPFEDLPTSEFVLDASGNWVDILDPIREEPSRVRRRESSPQAAAPLSPIAIHPQRRATDKPSRKRLRAAMYGVALVVLVAAAAWSFFSPWHALRLEQREIWVEPMSAWTFPEYGLEHRGGAPELIDQRPQRIVLKPIVIRASRTFGLRRFGLRPQAEPGQAQTEPTDTQSPASVESLTTPK